MKSRIFLVWMLFGLLNHLSTAQWQRLIFQYNGDCRVLHYDSLSTSLIVGGWFSQMNGISANKIINWDFSSWAPMDSGAPYGTPIYNLFQYQGAIFSSAIMRKYPDGKDRWLYAWNGANWDTTLGSFNGAVNAASLSNGVLGLSGGFDSISNQHCSRVALWDGSQWECLDLPTDWGLVTALAYYQNHWYAGGNFYDTLTGIHDLERWNGSAFESFGSALLSPGIDYVASMAVFQNELFISGVFHAGNGLPDDFIMRWDGQTLRDVGGGLNAQAFQLKVYKNHLYALGAFSNAGGIPVNQFAKWNGTQWSEVIPGMTTDLGISDFCFAGGDLFIGGAFNVINGDTLPIVARYVGYDLLLKNEQLNDLKPGCEVEYVNGNAVVQCSQLLEGFIIVWDAQGKRIMRREIRQGQCVLPMQACVPGLYLLQLEAPDGRSATLKFIKPG